MQYDKRNVVYNDEEVERMRLQELGFYMQIELRRREQEMKLFKQSQGIQ